VRLATKLTLSLTAGIFLVVGVHAWASMRDAVMRMEESHTLLLTERADLMTAAISATLESGNEVRARELLTETAGKVPQGRFMWLSASGAAPPEFRGGAEQWSRLLGGEAQGPIESEAGRFLSFYRPVLSQGKVVAVLGIEDSLADEQAEQRAVLVKRALMALALALVSGMVIALSTRRLVAKPLAEVTTQLRRIASDDLSGRVRVRGADQLGDLANEVNQMTVGLEIARNRIEEETRRRVAATAQLRHAGRLKVVGQLAASLAHELGTPLNVVSGRAQMISAGVATGEMAVECAQIIERQAERMATRIRGLLGFARRDVEIYAALDLATLAENTRQLLGHMMYRAGVTSRIEVAEGGPWRTHGCESELEQVVANLVTNAIQATPSGGSIRFGIRPATVEELVALPLPPAEGHAVCLEVEDDGAGMSPEVRERIFQPFFTTKAAAEGTGLGLVVCADIVREHGGAIEVVSELGVGTTFRLIFPGAPALGHDAPGAANGPDDEAV
jgi:two-component system NtrC family sensor kinase